MQMLTKVVLRRFDLVDDVSTSPTGISLSLTQVIDVVLMLEGSSSILLVLENFSEDAFSLCRVVVSVVLDRHAPAMNSIELTFDVLASG